MPLENIKHEIFATELINCKGNQTEAYMKTYGVDRSSAEALGSRVMSRDIRQRCVEILERQHGGTIRAVLEKLASLTDANKAIVVDKQLASVQDNATRMDAVKTILKLYGALDEHTTSTNINMNFESASLDQMSSVAKELHALNTALELKEESIDVDGEVIL